MKKFSEMYLLQEALRIKNAGDIIEAIKNGEMVKSLNGKKNLPAWIKDGVMSNDPHVMDFLLDTFETLLDRIHAFLGNVTGGTEYNEAVFLLIKKSVDLQTMSKIIDNDCDALINVAQSANKAWYKSLPIVQDVNNKPYDHELWHNLEKELQDKLATSRQRSSANRKNTLANLDETDTYTVLYQDDNWFMARPKSFEGDSLLASNLTPDEEGLTKTAWCTAANKGYYENYSRDGNGYYIIKTPGLLNATDAWQIAFSSKDHVEFMDRFDDRNFYDEFISKAPDELLSKIVIDNPNNPLEGLSFLWFKENGYSMDEYNLDETISFELPSFRKKEDYYDSDDYIDDSYYENDKKAQYILTKKLQDLSLSEVSKEAFLKLTNKQKIFLTTKGSDYINYLFDTLGLNSDQIFNSNILYCTNDNFKFIKESNLPLNIKGKALMNMSMCLSNKEIEILKNPSGEAFLEDWVRYDGGLSRYDETHFMNLAEWASYMTPEEIHEMMSVLKPMSPTIRSNVLSKNYLDTDIQGFSYYAKDFEYLINKLHVKYPPSLKRWKSIAKIVARSEGRNFDVKTINFSILTALEKLPKLDCKDADMFDTMPFFLLNPATLEAYESFPRIKSFLESSPNTYSYGAVGRAMHLEYDYSIVYMPIGVLLFLAENPKYAQSEIEQINELFNDKKETYIKPNVEALKKYLFDSVQLRIYSSLSPETQEFFLEHNCMDEDGYFRPEGMDEYVELAKDGKIDTNVISLQYYQKNGANRAAYMSKARNEELIPKDVINNEVFNKNDYLALKFIKEKGITNTDLIYDIRSYVRKNGMPQFLNISDYYLENFEYVGSPENIDKYGKEICDKFKCFLEKNNITFNRTGNTIQSFANAYLKGASDDELNNIVLKSKLESEYQQNKGLSFDNFYELSNQEKENILKSYNDLKSLPNIIKIPGFDYNQQEILKGIATFGKKAVISALVQFKKQNKSLGNYRFNFLCAEPGSFDKYDKLDEAKIDLSCLDPMLYATKSADEIINMCNKNIKFLRDMRDWSKAGNASKLSSIEFNNPELYQKVINYINTEEDKNKVERMCEYMDVINDFETLKYYVNADIEKLYKIHPNAADMLGVDTFKNLMSLTHIGEGNLAYSLGNIYSGRRNYNVSKEDFNNFINFLKENIDLVKESKEKRGLDFYRLDSTKIKVITEYIADLKNKNIPEDTMWEDYENNIDRNLEGRDIPKERFDLNRKYFNLPYRKSIPKYAYIEKPDLSDKDVNDFENIRKENPEIDSRDIDDYLYNTTEYKNYLNLRKSPYGPKSFYDYRQNKDVYPSFINYKQKGGRFEIDMYKNRYFIEESFKDIYIRTRI